MATDIWLGRAILGEANPRHPAGLPHDDGGSADYTAADFGHASPSYGEVLEARTSRQRKVREYLGRVTEDELAESRPNPHDPDQGSPEDQSETVLSCLQTILEEEWEHHRFAVRDLDALAAGSAETSAPSNTAAPAPSGQSPTRHVPIAWNGQLRDQTDFHWRHFLRDRLKGLSDEEHFWEPAPGWSVRPRGPSTAPIQAGALRSRGIATEVAVSAEKFGKQIRYADRRGIPFVWFTRTDDDGRTVHEVKDIRSGEQVEADPQAWMPPVGDLRPTVLTD